MFNIAGSTGTCARVTRAILLSLIVWFLPLSGIGWAAVYYVDQNHPNANDSNPGTSESAPWRTLHRATDGVPSREQGGGAGTFTPVGAGDTVFVKNGTYVDITTAIDNDPTPKFNPSNSGTSTAPLAFRAYTPSTGPRHRPMVSRNLHSNVSGNNPVLGTSSRNYIIWDGFATAPRRDLRIDSSTGVIIENMLIDKGGTVSPGGNYNGIFLQTTTDVTIRNNVIRNSFYNDAPSDSNGACIVSYDGLRVHVHNNDISGCNTGIFDKRNGVNNIYELNDLHDLRFVAIQVSAFASAPACGACPVDGIHFRRNIIRNTEVGIRVQGGSNVRNLHVYNNTVHGATAGRIAIVVDPAITGAAPPLFIYNNILIRNTAPTSSNRGHQVHAAGAGPPAGMLSNFNLYYGSTGPDAVFMPISYGSTETLAQWRARGFDANSLMADPRFMGPLPAVGPTAFRLQAGSPALNAGRTGGTSAGALVTMGAYISDADVIGPGAGAPPATPPAAPVSLRIVSQ